MTISSALSLAVAMFILAATPGPGLLLVSSQTAAHDLKAGFLTTIGILCADMLFIIIVTLGLATLTKQIHFLMPIVNFFGGCYLIYLGIKTLKQAKRQTNQYTNTEIEHTVKSDSSFILSGFLITLSNPKAILFYLSFLPAFIDLTQLTMIDVLIIMAIAIASISPTVLFFAWMTQKAKNFSQQNTKNIKSTEKSLFVMVSAYLIIAVGIYMLYRCMTLLNI